MGHIILTLIMTVATTASVQADAFDVNHREGMAMRIRESGYSSERVRRIELVISQPGNRILRVDCVDAAYRLGVNPVATTLRPWP